MHSCLVLLCAFGMLAPVQASDPDKAAAIVANFNLSVNGIHETTTLRNMSCSNGRNSVIEIFPYPWLGRAGIDDRCYAMTFYALLAEGLCATLKIPPPCMLLSPPGENSHQKGEAKGPIRCTWGWDRYFTIRSTKDHQLSWQDDLVRVLRKHGHLSTIRGGDLSTKGIEEQLHSAVAAAHAGRPFWWEVQFTPYINRPAPFNTGLWHWSRIMNPVTVSVEPGHKVKELRDRIMREAQLVPHQFNGVRIRANIPSKKCNLELERARWPLESLNKLSRQHESKAVLVLSDDGEAVKRLLVHANAKYALNWTLVFEDDLQAVQQEPDHDKYLRFLALRDAMSYAHSAVINHKECAYYVSQRPRGDLLSCHRVDCSR